MASKGLIKNVSRRTFLKYAGIGGLAAFGAFSALKYPSGWTKWLSFGQKPWEIAPGVVDYSLVAQFEGPMNTDGVPQAYIDNPDMRILNVAQWYDYWPGYVIRNFTDYMNKKFNLPACEARWTSNIYTSNEELFTWVTQTGRKFDVMVPTNYTVETMEKAGLLVNLEQDWIPNYLNIFGRVPSAPTTPFYPTTYTDPGTGLPATIDYPGFAAGDPYNNAASVDFRDPILNGYAYRGNTTTYATQKPHPGGGAWSDSNGIPTLDGLVAIPYQWGTTGIGYRQDVFRQQDIEAYGWDVLGLSSYTNPDSGITYDLTKKRMMLDDMREVFTAALKEVGFADQERLGAEEVSLPGSHPEWRNPAPPPVIFPPTTEVHKLDSPYNKLYQWSNNEVAETKLQDSADWLNGITGTMWGFNTPQQGPWLVSGTMRGPETSCMRCARTSNPTRPSTTSFRNRAARAGSTTSRSIENARSSGSPISSSTTSTSRKSKRRSRPSTCMRPRTRGPSKSSTETRRSRRRRGTPRRTTGSTRTSPSGLTVCRLGHTRGNRFSTAANTRRTSACKTRSCTSSTGAA